MRLSLRALNRATLARQLLLRREQASVSDALRRLLALQAQQPASPYLALWNRLDLFDPREMDVAFTERALVKATLMRITLHVVHIDDHAILHTAMQPTLRGARLNDRRFKISGLPSDDALAIVPELLRFTAQPRTSPAVETWLADTLDGAARPVWWALRTFAPLLRAPTNDPWSFGDRNNFVAAWAPPGPVDDEPDQHLPHLVRRYLAAFGPASVADVAQFALVQRARVRDAVRAIEDHLVNIEGPDGVKLLDVREGQLPPEDTLAPPRLLGMWDNVLLAHSDRDRIIPPQYRKLVTRSNGDVLPTLLVDGFVAGVWRAVDGAIEATAFHPLTETTWEGLEQEARKLLAFLADREPQVYGRYHHWWAKLPGGEVRMLS
jgi:hypothetical protein